MNDAVVVDRSAREDIKPDDIIEGLKPVFPDSHGFHSVIRR